MPVTPPSLPPVPKAVPKAVTKAVPKAAPTVTPAATASGISKKFIMPNSKILSVQGPGFRVAPKSISNLAKNITLMSSNNENKNTKNNSITRSDFYSYRKLLFGKLDTINSTILSILDFARDETRKNQEQRDEDKAERDQKNIREKGDRSGMSSRALDIGLSALAGGITAAIQDQIGDIEKLFTEYEKIDAETLANFLGENRVGPNIDSMVDTPSELPSEPDPGSMRGYERGQPERQQQSKRSPNRPLDPVQERYENMFPGSRGGSGRQKLEKPVVGSGPSEGLITFLKETENSPLAKHKGTSKAKFDNKQYSIGYGTKASSPDEVITEAEADKRLRNEVAKSYQYVVRYANENNYDWNQGKLDALTSFVYNLGGGRLKELTANGKRTDTEIAQALPMYNKSDGKVSPGLIKRRESEMKMFTDGGAGNTQVVPPVVDKPPLRSFSQSDQTPGAMTPVPGQTLKQMPKPTVTTLDNSNVQVTKSEPPKILTPVTPGLNARNPDPTLLVQAELAIAATEVAYGNSST